MIKYFTVIFFLVSTLLVAQTTKSEAYKKQGFTRKTPLFKPKYPSYNLAETYLLTEKAQSGDPFAQHELGIRYILGVGVPTDSVQAAYWIGKAASKNLPAANFNYGIILNNGSGIDWNPFLAFENFKVAAESGMEQGQYVYGLLHTDNLIVNKNLQEAYKWVKKAANKGFEPAIDVIEEFSKQGYVFESDSSSVTINKSTNVSSKQTEMLSQFDLDFYDFKQDTLSDEEEVEYLNSVLKKESGELKKMLRLNSKTVNNLEDTTGLGIINFAVKSGSPEALLIKGRLIENGITTKTDFIIAASNFLKAYRLGSYKAAELLLKISRKPNFYKNLKSNIDNGNPEAMYVWAGLIALGIDYSLTEKQAFELLQKAEKKNHLSSIIELGLAYYSGSLVEKDSIKALEYFRKAADLGSSEASVRLSFIELTSEPSIKNENNIKILRENIKNGSVLAEAALAYCYEKGISVEQHNGTASKLYRQAAQRGNEAAFNSLRKMYDQLRPEDEIYQIYLN